MKNVQPSLRKRKMLLMLPLLVIPFLTLLFWAMGGGKANGQSEVNQTKGLNLNLPNANLKDDQSMDKLSFYELAQKDSLKLAERLRNDPYLNVEDKLALENSGKLNELEYKTGQTAFKFNQPSVTTGLRTSPYSTSQNNPEDEIIQKLDMLQKEINKPVNESKEINGQKNKATDQSGSEFSLEVDRLEQMMQMMSTGSETDPEITQLENTLDKVLDVQHPERVEQRLKKQSAKNKDKVFPVSKQQFQSSVSLLDTSGKRKENISAFYGLEPKDESKQQVSIEAVVHQNQSLVNGAVIKLRLITNIFVNGTFIPKGSFVFGIVSLNGERLEAEINSIRYNNTLFPVKLEVYDMDGLTGIYIPGAIAREVAKGSMDNATQMLEITSLDPSFKTQAANAGLSAAKTLLSKKTKLVKVEVKAGYKVLLKDMNMN